MRLLHSIRGVAGRLLSAYGALFLARGAAGGALVLAATLLDPAIGLMGLAAGLAAMGARRCCAFPRWPARSRS
jgi:hypothetical protein